MSNFGFAIYGLLRRYKKETFDLADACNYPEHVICDWRYGRGNAPCPGHIITMARAFANTQTEARENHLSLLYAHLLDDCVGPAAKYLNLEVLPKALPLVVKYSGLSPLRRRSELDLEAIRRHIWYDTSLQHSIRELAAPLNSKPLPESLKQTKSKV